jgi:hypothetical protein
VTLSSGSYTSAATTLASGGASITIPAGALAAGIDTLTVSYTADASSSSTYNGASGTAPVTVTLITPTVTVSPGSSSITSAQSLIVTVTVSGGGSNPTPTGTVTLSSGTYTSVAIVLTAGSASINVPVGSLVLGTPTLTASFVPDTSSTSTYKSAQGTAQVTVTALATPTVTVSPGSNSITTAQALTVTVTLSASGSYPLPSGSVTLSSGTYNSTATLSSGSAIINVPAGSLGVGTDTLTASYTPDTTASTYYSNASGTGSVTVTSATPYTLTIDSTAPSSGISITVSPNDNNGAGSGTTPFTRTYYSGTQVTLSAALSVNGYSFVSWTGCTSNPTASNCVVAMGANTTVSANYNQTAVTSITVSPGTATIGTQQQFTATVNGTGSFSKGVTWSLSCSACGSLSSGTLSSTGLYTTPYPAPASVTVTATSTMTGFTGVSGSQTVTLSSPATATGPALTVDVNTPTTPSENPHAISPYVYGMNAYLLDSASVKIANPGILRWGGDDTSRYNYQTNMTNSASDYYFENFQGAGGQFPNPSGSTNFTQFVQSTDSAGAATLGTVPVLGWVANSTQYACGFPESQFPGQESYSPSNCGDGVYPDGTHGCTASGGCDLYGNATTQANTSVSEPAPSITTAPNPATAGWADATWSGGWVNSLVSNASYGNGASGKGVAMWDLDNEPTWWDAVHRDVHPNPFTYDEVTNNGLGTALAIKTADPTALVSGPVLDNWWAYFYSKKDIEAGWSSGQCSGNAPWSNPTDRTAHAGVPMIEYYLQQFQKYSANYGIRLLDYVDIHGYFEPDYNGNSVGFTTAGDTGEQQARMNGTRVFWDPTYTDPNFPQPNYITDSNYSSSCSPPAQSPELIPMLEKWVTNDYPGTKTGIDEYNFGGLESINGALVQADILGIFGRQGLNMSALWPTQAYNTQGPGNYAFAMYRNYDLANDGAAYGDMYLYATSVSSGSDAESQLAVYGAQRSSDKAITIMVINKTYGPLTSTVSIANFTAAGGTTAQVYQYSNANLNAIVPQTAVNVAAPTGGSTTSTISYTFPGQSITLFVVPD